MVRQLSSADIKMGHTGVHGVRQDNRVYSIFQNQIRENIPPTDTLVISAKKGLIKHNSFLHPDIELRDKGNGEKGVYAKKKIDKGEIVTIFVGDIINGEKLKTLSEDVQRKSLQLAPDLYQIASTDEMRAFDAAEHFNHSCNPNTFLTGNNILYANRDIQPGEEIRFDYGTSDTTGNPDTGWHCDCGTSNCRGGTRPDDYKRLIPKYSSKNVAHYLGQLFERENRDKVQ